MQLSSFRLLGTVFTCALWLSACGGGGGAADTAGRMPLTGPLDAGEARRIVLTGAVRLSNVRDTITLLDAHGVVVDQVSYQARGLPAEGRTKIFSV